MTREGIPEQVEHLFRHESGRLIATLTRILGVHNLDAAEEIVQETLLKALQVWPYHPPLDNPAAWLMRVAKNKAIDRIRRDRHRRAFAERYKTLLESEWTLSTAVERSFGKDEIADDPLRMIFTCCDPALAARSQIALTLRLLCGLSAAEIASAFLTTPATIDKRLFRAKRKLRESAAPFEVPHGDELLRRLDAVLKVLYLLFNEGYDSAHTAVPVRADLCREALRLALLVWRHPRTRQPKVAALVALMCFHLSRLPARLDDDGAILVLAEQDRGRWDRALIDEGSRLLDAASRGPELSVYHLEAAIAACHSRAADFESIDWDRIVQLYDLLLERQPSPIVRLNRAIALGHARGPREAIAELERLEEEPALRRYYLLPATLGEFHLRAGAGSRASAYFEKAISLTSSKAARQLLRRKLASCP